MHITSAVFVKGIKGTDDVLYDGTPQIVFVGRSNVGKSSMINTLVNRNDLVKVGKKPGKTTEINFFLVNKELYFVDLPGYGYAALPGEEREQIRKMIIWYLTESEVRPKKVVLIVDIKVGLTHFDEEMLKLLREMNHPYLVVANKADKLGTGGVERQLGLIRQACTGDEVVSFSSTAHVGTDALLQRIIS
ncbi:MAG: ribosome biogenesis GTP-binding protein YsxC [Candidatus Magasanikbacteria bacterium]|nr:ribosome biogenesis GTP-binding protein YsxC [Candidatus Magasanikbacteria bacterium]